jgi:hypothetical protein
VGNDGAVRKGFFRRHSHWWAVAIVIPLIVIAVGIGILSALGTYNSSIHGPVTGECQGNQTNNFVYIQATIFAVDTDSMTVTLRLDFVPQGNLVDATTGALTGSTTMVTAGLLAQPEGSSSAAAQVGTPSYTSASSSYAFLKGDYMQDLDVAVPLVSGTAGQGPIGAPSATPSARYPWDAYSNEYPFVLQVRRGIGSAGVPIPTCVGLTASVGGWTVSEQPDSISGNTPYNGFDIVLVRSAPVKFYSYFVMGLMWALALGGVAMAVIMIMRKQDEIDTAAFAYLAALLFAFPLIRSTLPGSPGPGSLIDVLAYYWTEVIVALTLVVLLVRWITITGKHDHPEPDQKPDDDEVVDPAEPVGIL